MQRKAKPGSKPRLGQNFLVDTAAQRRIVEALGSDAAGNVVEIGPGKAAITALLAERAARLIAIELDPALASRLRTMFASMGSVEILEADVLEVDLTALARAAQSKNHTRPLAVVGNLPYYITSPILQHLFTHEAGLSRAVVMVQREVAERVTAVPGTSDYGLLSVLSQIYARVELLFSLPPGAFSPPPEVHSAVVRFDFAPRWAELGVTPAPFTAFLRACFAQKRKTLANNLRAAGYRPAAVAASLPEAGATARAEEQSPSQLANLFLRMTQPP